MGDDEGLNGEGNKVGEPGVTDSEARGSDGEGDGVGEPGSGDTDGNARAPKVNATSRRAYSAS